MAWRDEIRHIVVLMLENQSFDRLLGFFRLPEGSRQPDGLTGTEAVPISPADPSRAVRVRRVTTAAAYVTEPTPGHQIEDVTQQLFGEERVPDPPTPTMNGFVWNYARQDGPGGRPLGAERAAAIMECLDPALVPVITTLAASFVVCDRWFSSLPGPTWPNRFFAHCGTSGGHTESPTEVEQMLGFLGGRFGMRSIYENLASAGQSWAVYFGDHAQAFALSNLHRFADTGFQRLESFAEDVERGTLPSYAFLEPVYMETPGSPASDEHPPHHLLEGERLIGQVYDTLRSNEDLWRRSLLVVLYDEHGGFYDHVPPPTAVAPDDVSKQNPAFRFDRLGVRVPALLVSPWVRKGWVDHRTYDHTSLLATVRALFGLPQPLTRRDAQASALDDDNFLESPREADDMPSDLANLVPARPPTAVQGDQELSDLQRSLLALDAALQRLGGPAAARLRTIREARDDEPQGP